MSRRSSLGIEDEVAGVEEDMDSDNEIIKEGMEILENSLNEALWDQLYDPEF